VRLAPKVVMQNDGDFVHVTCYNLEDVSSKPRQRNEHADRKVKWCCNVLKVEDDPSAFWPPNAFSKTK
jgi:hypothetical protein